ncbi:hypothetical protein BsWGS_07783 [Bradybaena similaris]
MANVLPSMIGSTQDGKCPS